MCYHYSQTDSQTEDRATTDAPVVGETEYSTLVFGQAVHVKLTPGGGDEPETRVDLDPGADVGAPKAYAVPGDASQARSFVESFVAAFESSADDLVEQLHLAAGLGSPALGRVHAKFGSRPLNANS